MNGTQQPIKLRSNRDGYSRINDNLTHRSVAVLFPSVVCNNHRTRILSAGVER